MTDKLKEDASASLTSKDKKWLLRVVYGVTFEILANLPHYGPNPAGIFRKKWPEIEKELLGDSEKEHKK
jgi:hypothetical protein